MQLTAKAWNEYITRLARLNTVAGKLMRQYIDAHGTVDFDALIAYAHALVTKYGEGSAELACQMYDAAAEASGVTLPPAEPAETASREEVARMVNGNRNSPPNLQSGVSRLVKQAAADTTLKNAIRDGAEFAWVPHGDTCPFCIMLASNGWQKAGKKTLDGSHAKHIHAHCNCEYAVRFDSSTTVAGYDPDKYLKQYRDAGGDLNEMRRRQYARNRVKINAQKRAAYAARKLHNQENSAIIDYSKAVFSGDRDIKWHLEKHKSEFTGWTEEQYLQRAREILQAHLESGELEEIKRSDGSVSRYRFSTNEFVATTNDGNIRTFFKPKEREVYWKYEHERN